MLTLRLSVLSFRCTLAVLLHFTKVAMQETDKHFYTDSTMLRLTRKNVFYIANSSSLCRYITVVRDSSPKNKSSERSHFTRLQRESVSNWSLTSQLFFWDWENMAKWKRQRYKSYGMNDHWEQEVTLPKEFQGDINSNWTSTESSSLSKIKAWAVNLGSTKNTRLW